MNPCAHNPAERDRDRHVEHPAEMESEFRSDPTARDASIEPDQPSFAPERETSEQSEMDVEESPSVPASEVEMQAEPNQEPAGAPEAPAFAAKGTPCFEAIIICRCADRCVRCK